MIHRGQNEEFEPLQTRGPNLHIQNSPMDKADTFY